MLPTTQTGINFAKIAREKAITLQNAEEPEYTTKQSKQHPHMPSLQEKGTYKERLLLATWFTKPDWPKASNFQRQLKEC